MVRVLHPEQYAERSSEISVHVTVDKRVDPSVNLK